MISMVSFIQNNSPERVINKYVKWKILSIRVIHTFFLKTYVTYPNSPNLSYVTSTVRDFIYQYLNLNFNSSYGLTSLSQHDLNIWYNEMLYWYNEFLYCISDMWIVISNVVLEKNKLIIDELLCRKSNNVS